MATISHHGLFVLELCRAFHVPQHEVPVPPALGGGGVRGEGGGHQQIVGCGKSGHHRRRQQQTNWSAVVTVSMFRSARPGNAAKYEAMTARAHMSWEECNQ